MIRLVEATSSDRTRIATLAFREGNDATSLWLANLRDHPQRVMLPDLDANARIGRLDESTFEAAATEPAFLHAHATALASREIEIGAHGIAWIQMGR